MGEISAGGTAPYCGVLINFEKCCFCYAYVSRFLQFRLER